MVLQAEEMAATSSATCSAPSIFTTPTCTWAPESNWVMVNWLPEGRRSPLLRVSTAVLHAPVASRPVSVMCSGWP
ncbi:hypothetical protein BJF82_10845 [Kytococcus sp. CUA-901]|nr:hypothetical protein BJF82_10845 [Kytococcus sp. CUA-901]